MPATSSSGQARHVLVLGGARSGKTRRALAHADGAAEKIYVATAQAFDREMEDRIGAHKEERAGQGWRTIEAPLDLAGALSTDAPPEAIVVVDCLTLWLTNLMLGGHAIEGATDALVAAMADTPARVVLVSNEVGLGIVPENALARQFRDAQGRLNQRLAATVGTVEFVVAGLVLRMK